MSYEHGKELVDLMRKAYNENGTVLWYVIHTNERESLEDYFHGIARTDVPREYMLPPMIVCGAKVAYTHADCADVTAITSCGEEKYYIK